MVCFSQTHLKLLPLLQHNYMQIWWIYFSGRGAASCWAKNKQEKRRAQESTAQSCKGQYSTVPSSMAATTLSIGIEREREIEEEGEGGEMRVPNSLNFSFVVD